jgi:ParB family chromosome partitioning protein
VSSNQYHLASLAPSGEGKALTALKAQKKALQATLPENWHLDFTWLLSWSAEQVNTLLGFCAARYQRYSGTYVNQRRKANWTGWKRRWTLTCANGGSRMLRATSASSRSPRLAMPMKKPDSALRRVVKLKRRDAAKAAEQDLNAQGWLPDWMVRSASR